MSLNSEQEISIAISSERLLAKAPLAAPTCSFKEQKTQKGFQPLNDLLLFIA
jgi:hypothetical protein